jgi:molybdate transport system regulatory protein
MHNLAICQIVFERATESEILMGRQALTSKPRLSLRIDFGNDHAIGPGKIHLLELIDTQGSISAAARAMGMSYRRAWVLVDELNHAFKSPVVISETGGSGGGGAKLTKEGKQISNLFRQLEAGTAQAFAAELTELASYLAKTAAPGKASHSSGLLPKRKRPAT